MKKVAVTGAGGYIGTQLVRDLLKEGYEVLAIDRYFFGMEPMKEFIDDKRVTILKKDIRDLEIIDLNGINVVCDLACLSNDPAGEMDPNLTYSINRDGRIHVAEISKRAGVERYIISSSCSVYGTGSNVQLTEKSETNPISTYAKSTLDAETYNLNLSSNTFSVTALRNATVYGLSSRMRFDLVVNLMTLSAFQKNRIIVLGGGIQWRPLVHIKDVVRAFILTIEAKVNEVNREIFNIGLDNFQIKNLAFIIKEALPINIEVEIAPDDVDKRDYNVSFEKMKKQLNFVPSISIVQGVDEIYQALKLDKVDTGIKTFTVKWYRNIIESNELINQIKLNSRII